MKILPISELFDKNIDFYIRDVFQENWIHQKKFLLYKKAERPCSALFFACSNTELSYFLSDGTPVLTAHSGDVVFIPKGVRYYACVPETPGLTMHTYTVNLDFFDERRECFLLSDHISLLGHFDDVLHELHLNRLCTAFHQEKRNLILEKGELFSLLEQIRSSTVQNDDLYYPIRKSATAFCKEWNQNRKPEEYAEMDGISVTYFYRCFRKWSGYSPIEYRNKLRLSHAESLLRCTDLKVSEISETIGFHDPFYFCRLFKKSYGLSPNDYRKTYRR